MLLGKLSLFLVSYPPTHPHPPTYPPTHLPTHPLTHPPTLPMHACFKIALQYTATVILCFAARLVPATLLLSCDQWRTEGFWHPGRRWECSPLPLGVSDWQASKALSLAIGGSGAEPQLPMLLGAFGCEWNPILNSVNTIFNLACQTGKRRSRSPSLLGGLGRSFWEHLGVNGTHFKIALTPLSTRHIRLARAEDAPHRYWGSGVEPQPLKLLGAFGCKWNPFLNSANTIFNSECQTDKALSFSIKGV